MAAEDDELEGIRRRKLEELQRFSQDRAAVEDQQARVNAQKQSMLRQILTPEARERLGRLKLAYPEVVENVENQLLMLAQSGRLRGVVDDRTLIEILERVMPRKREIKIERR